MKTLVIYFLSLFYFYGGEQALRQGPKKSWSPSLQWGDIGL